MIEQAYKIGESDALKVLGFKTANARLLGSLAGAGLGAAVAPENEGIQGGVLGGIAGFAAGAGVSRLFQGGKNLATTGLNKLNNPISKSNNLMSAQGLYPKGVKAPPLQNPPGSPQALINAPALQKTSDLSTSLNLPGTPLNMQLHNPTERMPGMRKWVPRDVIERAYSGLDMGLDEPAIVDIEKEQGSLKHPAIGAGIATALTHFNLPKAGLSSKLLAGFAGAGTGAMYNQYTAKDRSENATEALQGIARERGVIKGQDRTTSSESTPLVVARSSS